MSDIRHGILITLSSGTTRFVAHESEHAARASAYYAAVTWLRFPPEARPASCWLISRSHTAPSVTEEGVGEEVHADIVAVVDPRAIEMVEVVSIKAKEPWEGA